MWSSLRNRSEWLHRRNCMRLNFRRWEHRHGLGRTQKQALSTERKRGLRNTNFSTGRLRQHNEEVLEKVISKFTSDNELTNRRVLSHKAWPCIYLNASANDCRIIGEFVPCCNLHAVLSCPSSSLDSHIHTLVWHRGPLWIQFWIFPCWGQSSPSYRKVTGILLDCFLFCFFFWGYVAFQTGKGEADHPWCQI